MKNQRAIWKPVAGILSVTAALLSVYCLTLTIQRLVNPLNDERLYSFVGFDYPAYYPLSVDRKIATAMDDTVHYGIFEPEAAEDWASNQAEGRGYARLGPEKRGFAISMFHQLHCLRVMRWALSGHYDEYSRGHVQHCLNYLRQEILCSPDLTLEPSDILTRDHEIERAGAIHVCKDWRVLYADLAANWNEWAEFKEDHGEEILAEPSFTHNR